MALLDFLFKRRDATQDTTQDTTQETTPVVDDVLLQALLQNDPITREMALTIPAVSAAVDFISSSIACMPVKLYKYKDDRVEEVRKDTRTRILNSDTGDTLDAFQMKKALVTDYLLGKGGYAYIRRDRNDFTGLFYVKDIRITAYPNYEPIFKKFYILVEGNSYYPHEFIKLLRNTKDGATGIGLLEEVSKTLETAFNTLTYQLGIVSTGGNKKGFLTSEYKLDQDTIDTLKQAWRNLYANNTENVVVLNKGLDFKESSNTSVEMQLNESKKTLQDEINNIFHIEDDFDLTFKKAIYPIIKAFETALNRDFLLEKEKGKMFFEFDVKEIVRANIKERYEAYGKALKDGWKTINEVRREENENSIDGMDVLNLGLGAVLYDVNTHTYYTPNTDTKSTLEEETITEDIPTDETMPDGVFDIDEEQTKELEKVVEGGEEIAN